MRKPVIPVSRFRPFIGQPPTTGIPRKTTPSLNVVSQRTRRFVAGVVIALGAVSIPPAGSLDAKGIKVYSVRNDFRNGKLVKLGAVRTPPPPVAGLSPKGIRLYSVRNDRSDGRIFRYKVPFVPRIDETIVIHRMTSPKIYKRFRPIFGQIPPISTEISQWKVQQFKIHRQSERYQLRRYQGRVLKFGPRLTGEIAGIVPSTSRGISIIFGNRNFICGSVIRFGAPRGTFALNVDRIPRFKVVQNRSSYQSRRPQGDSIRWAPKHFTQICFRPLTVIRGSEIVISGQNYYWGPRRVNFIPPIEQRVPKPLKISRRSVLPYRGRIIIFGPERSTTVASVTSVTRGIRVYQQRPRIIRGKVLTITPFKRNPPATGTLNHGLIRLSNFRTTLSVKRENDGGKSDVFAADASGTVIAFNKSFKIVESITVTPLTTALQSAIYDFTHTTLNPTTFLVKLFDNTGARINGTVSWKARGIL